MDLNEAVIEFASRAAQKLRSQGSLASQVLVFIRTSAFRKDPQYSRSTIMPLRRPSADTAVIVASALAGLHAIYRPGFKLAKAGGMLLDLQPDTVQQGALDLQDDAVHDSGRLMTALDGLPSLWPRHRTDGKCRAGGGPAGLGHEAEAPDAGVHDVLG